MYQNQNRFINQFLQSKLNNNQNNSAKATNNNEPYFDKKFFNKISKKISPNLKPLNGDYLNFAINNNLKTTYLVNMNNSTKYYSINNHNHSEYITNYSSDHYPKIILARKNDSKSNESRTYIFPEDQKYYSKTEENAIRRALSGNYKNKLEEMPYNNYNQKKCYTYNKEKRKLIEAMQSSPSQPSFFKNNYNIEENNNNNLNYKEIKIYKDKTFSKGSSQNCFYSFGLEDNAFNSISNIHSDSENKNKPIRNYKSSNIINNRNNYTSHNINNYENNNISDNKIILKNNYKYHSITVKKNNKVDKNEMREDFKKKYNINTSINKSYFDNNAEKISSNLLSIKIKSPILSNNKRSNIKKIKNRVIKQENENLDLTNNYKNHSLFESINIKKDREFPEKIKLKNNINTFIESSRINNKRTYLYINNNYINNKNIKSNENKNLQSNKIRLLKDNGYNNNNNSNNKSLEKNNKKINNKSDIKDKVNNFGYESDIVERYNKKSYDIKNQSNKDNNTSPNNIKISYIYERKKKKQKSLTEESKEFNISKFDLYYYCFK
jgi:hypothetical protein